MSAARCLRTDVGVQNARRRKVRATEAIRFYSARNRARHASSVNADSWGRHAAAAPIPSRSRSPSSRSSSIASGPRPSAMERPSPGGLRAHAARCVEHACTCDR